MDSIKKASISPQDPYGKLLCKYVIFYASTIVNVELCEKITLLHAQASGVHRHAIHMYVCVFDISNIFAGNPWSPYRIHSSTALGYIFHC